MYSLVMADVIAKWQDGTATFSVLRMADVIAMWQDGAVTFVLKDGRCYCHVADVISTICLIVATNMGYKSTPEEVSPSKTPWLHPQPVHRTGLGKKSMHS